MINTIFYFVDNFDTYKNKLDRKEITAKTIVFVKDQKAIYKDGIRYGSSSDSDLYSKFLDFYNTTYDDSWIRSWLDRVESVVTNEQTRLSNLIANLNIDIQNKVNSMFNDATWLQTHVAQNELFHQNMQWNEKIQAFLQEVGMWTQDSQGNTVTQWSKIQQDLTSINSEVNALTQGLDNRFTAVQSSINQSVDQKIQTAKTEIGNMYATGTDVNNIRTVVEWMYSGLKSSAGPTSSIAQILSAGRSNAVGAISDVRTQVDKLNENEYVTTSSLTNQIESYITGQLSTAGLVSENTLSSALSTVFARLDNPSTGISGWSDLATTVDYINGHYIATSGLVTQIQSDINSIAPILSQSGFVSRTTIDDAVAELFASNSSSNTKAAVQAIATSGGQSQIVLTADNVVMDTSFIDASTSDMKVKDIVAEELTAGTAQFNGDVTANSFTAGNPGEPGIVVQAGDFDSTNADTSKVYIANDPRQQGVSMFFFDTYDNTWRAMQFDKCFTRDSFTAHNLYSYSSLGGTIPADVTSLSPSDMATRVTWYANAADNKWYTTTAAAVGNLATPGTYYRTEYKDSRHQYDEDYTLQYVGTKNNKLILAVIPLNWHYNYNYRIIIGNDGTTSSSPGSNTSVYDSDQAILSCTVASDGTVSNIQRGRAFLKGVQYINEQHSKGISGTGPTDIIDLCPNCAGIRNVTSGSYIKGLDPRNIVCQIIDTDNKVYDVQYDDSNTNAISGLVFGPVGVHDRKAEDNYLNVGIDPLTILYDSRICFAVKATDISDAADTYASDAYWYKGHKQYTNRPTVSRSGNNIIYTGTSLYSNTYYGTYQSFENKQVGSATYLYTATTAA